MKTTVAGLSLIVAAVFGVAAAVPAPAMAADNTVNLLGENLAVTQRHHL